MERCSQFVCTMTKFFSELDAKSVQNHACVTVHKITFVPLKANKMCGKIFQTVLGDLTLLTRFCFSEMLRHFFKFSKHFSFCGVTGNVP